MFFEHEDEWKSHMTKSHSNGWHQKVHTMMWYCDLGHTTPLRFDNELACKNHMQDRAAHPGRRNDPTGPQLKALLAKKQQHAPRDQNACPFCEDIPATISEKVGQVNESGLSDLLTRHIGDHVKSLSFMALPLEPDGSEEGQNSVTFENSCKRSRGPNSVAEPPSGASGVASVLLQFSDDDTSKDELYTIQSEDDLPDDTQLGHINLDIATEVDHFFSSVPETDGYTLVTWAFALRYKGPRQSEDQIIRNWQQNQVEKSDLEVQLYNAKVKSEFPPGVTNEFIPRSRVDKIITKESVIKELCFDSLEKSLQEEELEKLPKDASKDALLPARIFEAMTEEEERIEKIDMVNFISEEAKSLFCITIFSGLRRRGLLQAMKMFLDAGFSDLDLPIIPGADPILPGIKISHKLVQSTDMDYMNILGEKPAPFRNDLWNDEMYRAFLRNQWTFLAPVFPKGVSKLILKLQHKWPFTVVNKVSISGLVGDMYQVMIHESHQEQPMRKVRA